MRTEHLSYLLAVAQYGSINKASQQLHIHQQQLSKIINSMEEELGTRIFMRTNKGVTLTPQGRQVIASATIIVNQLNQVHLQLKQGYKDQPPTIKGSLNIHSITNIWSSSNISHIISEFTTHYPQVNINFYEDSTSQIIAQITHSSDKIGIIQLADSRFNLNPSIPENLIYIPVLQTQVAIYGSKDYPALRHCGQIKIERLLQEPLVIYKPRPDFESDIINTLKAFGTPKIKYQVSNLKAFQDILSHGKAITVGAYRQIDWFAPLNLVMVPLDEDLTITTGLLVPKHYAETPLMKAFVDYYIDHSL